MDSIPGITSNLVLTSSGEQVIKPIMPIHFICFQEFLDVVAKNGIKNYKSLNVAKMNINSVASVSLPKDFTSRLLDMIWYVADMACGTYLRLQYEMWHIFVSASMC